MPDQASLTATEPATTRYLEPDSPSARLFERAQHSLPGGNTRLTVHQEPRPPYAARGHGCFIESVDGDRWLDFFNNATTLVHGHADPDVIQAVMDTMSRGTCLSMPTETEIDLAELMTARVASVEKIRFANSGSEGVMLAVKAARAFTGRSKIAKFEGCYHGAHEAVEPNTAPPPESWRFEEPQTVSAAEGTPRHILEHTVVMRYNHIPIMERLLERHHADLAAVIVDLMPMRSGLIRAEKAFLERLRALSAQYGIVLIFDEVISYRVAPGGLQSLVGVTPDLTTFGKIIGGGFPVGACGGRSDIMAVFDPRGGHPRVPHAGTFNANPVTMIAGATTLRKLTPQVYSRLEQLGDMARAGLRDSFAEVGVPVQVTGAGSLFGVLFHNRPIREYRDLAEKPEETKVREAVQTYLKQHGIHMMQNLIGSVSTPMGSSEIDRLVATVRDGLRELPN
ncbi:MAG: aspartate aminotransferase family protein [Gemmatimonadota bacterium]